MTSMVLIEVKSQKSKKGMFGYDMDILFGGAPGGNEVSERWIDR